MSFDGQERVNPIIEEKVNERRPVLVKIQEKKGNVLVLPRVEVGQRQVVEMNEAEREYLKKALTKMPNILAVHATFNMDERPELDGLPDRVIPMIGLEAPPRTGKTVMLLTTELENPDLIRVWDWDTFSPQAYEQMKESFWEK